MDIESERAPSVKQDESVKDSAALKSKGYSLGQHDANHDLELTRYLVMRYGWNATAYQIVNPGIERWFSTGLPAVVGYVRKARTRVVAGAPVCDGDCLAQVFTEWETECERFGDRVCYFGASGRVKEYLDSLQGYSTVTLGAQPVWNPAGWDEIITRNASLRAQLNRARNKGVRVEEWSPDQAVNSEVLRECLDHWLKCRGLPPLHFLVEPQTLFYLRDRRIFVAILGQKVVGFTVLSPVPQRNGWLTEQFPRGAGSPNGTVELLMDSAVRAVGLDGAEYLTMGLVPLSEHGGSNADAPEWLRVVLAWIRAHGKRFYNFRGLEWFKAKFEPHYWEPIYAVSKEESFSFRSLYAIAEAFSDQPPMALVARSIFMAVQQELRWVTSGR